MCLRMQSCEGGEKEKGQCRIAKLLFMLGEDQKVLGGKGWRVFRGAALERN